MASLSSLILKRPLTSSFIPLHRLLTPITSPTSFNSSLPFSNDPKTPIQDLLKNSSTFLDLTPESPKDLWTSPPYPKESIPHSKESPKYPPVDIDPRETSIFLFPGQGSQVVGMGKNLLKYSNVKEMFEMAGEIVGYDLMKLCLEGPRSELDKTVHCQPAILITSLAAVEKLKSEMPKLVENCVTAAGFSVGEYAALVFSGAISFEDAVKVVRIRAEAMQAASEIVPSGMMTIFYGADGRVNYACAVAKEWCRKLGLDRPECRIANYLYPSCKVIAGNEEALQFIEMNAQDFGIRRIKRLAVSGAFHTDLMLPAEEPLRKALDGVEITAPLIPVYSNVDGKTYRKPKQIRDALVEQVSSPVKWEQILHKVYEREAYIGNKDEKKERYPQTFECGPGKTLQAILNKVNRKAEANMVPLDI